MLTRSTNVSPSIHGFHYATARSPRHSAASARRPLSSSPLLSDSVSSTPMPISGRPSVSLPVSQRPPPPAAADAAAVDAAVAEPAEEPAQPAPAETAPPPPAEAAAAEPRHYEAVDAATQYSPMEPFDYAAHPHRYPPKPATPLEPPPIPGPTPMEPGIEQGVDQADVSRDSRRPMRGGPSAAATASAAARAAAATTPKTASRPLEEHTMSPNKRRSSHGPEPDGDGANDADRGGPASPSSLSHAPQTGSKRIKAEAEPPKLLPERYELCAVEDMVVLIANMLSELIETNDALALKAGHLTRFHSRTAPGISVLDYLNRLAKHVTLTPPLLLSMVYYIDRLCAMYPKFTINTLTVHRFLITAATVAAKGLSDSFWNNSTYARVGGVPVAELKMLELEFLCRLEWKIVPNPEVLAAYYRPLVERCPGYALPAGSHDEDKPEGSVAAAGNGNGSSSVLSAHDDGHVKTSGAGE